MLDQSQSSYPLLRQFREFYVEVARLRRLAGQGAREGFDSAVSSNEAEASLRAAKSASGVQAANSSVAVEEQPVPHTASQPGDPEGATQQIWHEMANYLDQRIYELQFAPGSLAHDLEKEMIYVMAAFADEVFVCLEEWLGQDYWRDRLMETRLFRTQIAGQEIFRRIDRLLSRRDFGTEELAAVYLMVLALGFRGQYLRDPAMVEAYRKNLFNRLLLTNPDLRRQSERLFPKAYLHTVVDGAPVRLPEPVTWWLIVAGVVSAWLLLSTMAWLALTNPVRNALHLTNDSLDRATKQQAATSASEFAKWIVFPFALVDGGFQLELPASLPSQPAGKGGPPLLIAVQGMAGKSAGPEGQVEVWLSGGTVDVRASGGAAPGSTRPVVSVAQLNRVPAGITADESAMYFLVTAKLAPSELFLRPQLDFAAPGKYGLAVDSVTLYLPGKSTAGVP